MSVHIEKKDLHIIETKKITTDLEARAAHETVVIEQSSPLSGEVSIVGAKNAVLVAIASLILTDGVSVLHNVPVSDDVFQMCILLQDLGATVLFDQKNNRLEIDTSSLCRYHVSADIMKKMRASILVMGPLLARFSRADIALPGGCAIGMRPIDFHIKNFEKLGAIIKQDGDFLTVMAHALSPQTIVLEYPSVGATENIIMASVMIAGITTIINAALEPEVVDLIAILNKMGALITLKAPGTITIEGVNFLRPVTHTVIADRLEAGSLLLAGAVTGGVVTVRNCQAEHLSVFLLKLEQMGHHIQVNHELQSITLVATGCPQAVSFTTSPYPGFPTDLQAPMMVAQTIASGMSNVHETVFENRLLHVRELQKMGAHITVVGDRACVTSVDELYGSSVIATDIRAACALALAGLVAKGTTVMSGISHWRRGYQGLEHKLAALGGRISLKTTD